MPATRDSGSVLIVSASQTSYQAIRTIIQGSFARITQAVSMAQAKQKAAACTVDILIINTPMPDEFGMQSALDILARNRYVSILLLVKQDLYPQVSMKIKGSGIYVLTKPLKGQALLEAVSHVETTRQRIASLENDLTKLKARLDEMGLITRAKCLLIEKRHMSEEESHYYLERTAMDGSMTKIEAAKAIVRELEDAGGS
jgi:AmiR/NasT family two-component response regulator